MRAAVRIRDGRPPWVATNTDATFPPRSAWLPGTVSRSTCCAASPASTWSSPANRPGPLLDETVRRVGGRRPLMVGDRLDTDIGALVARPGVAAGC